MEQQPTEQPADEDHEHWRNPDFTIASRDHLQARGPQERDQIRLDLGGQSIIFRIQDGVAYASTHHARLEDLQAVYSELYELKRGGEWAGVWEVKDQSLLIPNGPDERFF